MLATGCLCTTYAAVHALMLAVWCAQVLTGVFLNVLCVGIVTLTLNTIGRPIFGLGTFPTDVVNCSNTTALLA